MLLARDPEPVQRPQVYRYRPQRLATISLTVLPGAEDPRTAAGQPSHTAASTPAPGRGHGRTEQAEPDRPAFAAPTAVGVPSMHGSLD